MGNDFATGLVRATHGLDGTLKVESLSGETAHFFNLKSAVLRKAGFCREFAVEKVRASGATVLLNLAGVGSQDEAKSLVGCEVVVSRECACPLCDGEFYIEDLKLCSVFFAGGCAGKIVGVFEGGGGFLLQVELTDEFLGRIGAIPGDRMRLVPFRKEFVGQVDLENFKVELVSLAILE